MALLDYERVHQELCPLLGFNENSKSICTLEGMAVQFICLKGAWVIFVTDAQGQLQATCHGCQFHEGFNKILPVAALQKK